MKTKLKLMPALVAGAVAAITIPAAAGPTVTAWTYSTDAKFIAPTQFETGGTGTTTAAAYELSWGATGGDYHTNTNNSDNNRSALTIGKNTTNLRDGGGPVTGSINTTIGGTPNASLDQIKNGVTFTHWNNTISGNFNELLGGTVEDSLTLTPLVPLGGSSYDLPKINFTFKFSETTNNPGGQGNNNCAGGTAEPCADLFGIVGFSGNVNQSFTYDGNTYFASIYVLDQAGNASPFALLLPGECQALGLGNTCQGFRTKEAAQTTAQFAFSITTDRIEIPGDVPEPASLALVGVALAGLGVASARRRRG